MIKWLLALLMVLQFAATPWAEEPYDSETPYDSEAFISSHTLECVTRLGDSGDWVIIKNRLYLFQANQIIILDVSGEEAREINRVRLAGPYTSFAIKYPALYVSCDDFAYTKFAGTIGLFDLRDVGHPKFIEHIFRNHKTSKLLLNSRYLKEEENFKIWNIQEPLSPKFISETDIQDGKIDDIHLDDEKGFLYTVPQNKELYFNSVDDKSTTITELIKPWIGPNCPLRLAIREDLCALTSGTSIGIIDITNIHLPSKISTLDLKTELVEIGMNVDYLYALGMDAKLHIVSLDDLLHPVEVGTLDLPGKGIKLELIDSRAFIITASHYDEMSRYRHENLLGDTIIALDCSDPRHPVPAGKLKLPCQDLLADGTRLFVAANKLALVDTTDLMNLTIKAQSALSIPTPAPGEPEDPEVNVVAVWNYLTKLNGLMLGLSPMCLHEAKDYAFGCINCYTINQFATPVMNHQLTGPQFTGLWSDGKSLYTKTSYSNTCMRMNVLMQARLDEKLNLIPIAGNLDFGEINDIAFYKDYILVADEYGLAILKKH